MTLLTQDHAAQEPNSNQHPAAPAVQRHVVRRLRRLVPQHSEPISWLEAERISRAQAALLSRLSEHAGLDVVDFVSTLPTVRVELDPDLPGASGGYWDSRAKQWVVVVRTVDDEARRRFSALHEFKRIIDRGHTIGLYDPRDTVGAVQAGMAADQFARHCLMPARRFRAAAGAGASVANLARDFRVPSDCAAERMSELNLLAIINNPERRESS